MTANHMTPAEAATRAGVSIWSIYRAIKTGRLRAARLGHRTVRISPADLAAWLAPA